LVAVLILTPLLLLAEKNEKEPILNVRLFKSRQVLLVGFIALGVGLFQSTIVFLPKLSIILFGVEPSRASFMLLPVVIATAIGSPVTGRLIDKLGSRIIVFGGLFFAMVALFLLGMLLKSPGLFYTGGALLGLGLAMRASLNYIMLNEVPPRERASTQGILVIFISAGQLTGAALIGALTGSMGEVPGSYSSAFLVMAGISVILVILSFFLKSRKKELKNGLND
jgi:MFS family permease